MRSQAVTLSWWMAILMTLASIEAGKGKQHRSHQVSSNDSGDRLFVRGRASPHEFGLRPSPSIGIPPLREDSNAIYDPRPKDFNNTHLRQRLGINFDTNFMSIHRPLHLRNQTLSLGGHMIEYEFPFRKNRRGRLVAKNPEALPDWLRQLRFRHVWLVDGTKARTSVSGEKLEHKLRNFLWAHTSCPVVYRWRDLGRRFWPRWLKEGHCPQGKESCSIPPGMKCQQAESSYKQVLRWHCRNWELRQGCHWLKVQYPIVTRCSCRCPGAEDMRASNSGRYH